MDGRSRRIIARQAERFAGPLIVAVLLSGCATASRELPRTTPRPEPDGERDLEVPSGSRVRISGSLVDHAQRLLGSPYRYAGSDPSGFDCSGLTTYLFANAGVELPRTAAEQAEVGRWVALDELGPGDLVFFANGDRKPHHVGLVVSRPGERLTMIHASTSSGVEETEIPSSDYWLRRLRFGRRVEIAERRRSAE